MKPEELSKVVEEAVSKAISKHPCWMSETERAMVRDMMQAGGYVKKTILGGFAIAILYAIFQAVMMAKGWK